MPLTSCSLSINPLNYFGPKSYREPNKNKYEYNTVMSILMQGTEYYDGKAKRYVDFPITDILQMMGRAGRPQYDQHGKAVILVHEPKKSFYKKVG